MKIMPTKKHRKTLLLLLIPILIIAQYYFYKIGILKPMVRGVELNIVQGEYVTDVDHFVMRLNDKVTLSSGEIIYIPSYAKKPNIRFNVLEDNGVLKIEDSNQLVSMKEGTSTIGIMKNSRVLRKVNIKVVDPKVKEIIVLEEDELKNELKYVGDTTTINSIVEVDYNKFKTKESATYESSNESVIKVNDNIIEAVGVGNAKVYIKAKDEQKVLDFSIKAKISKIDINDIIEVEINKSKKIKPNIITSPKGLKYPKVKYELVEKKLPVQRSIALNTKDGTVTGILEGQEKVKITCGDLEKIITIKVVEKDISNTKVENLDVNYEVVGDKLQVSLMWDYIENVFNYDIYLRNNSLQESKFKVYNSCTVKKEDIPKNKRIGTTIEIDLIEGKIPDISLFVVGKTKNGTTNKSNIVNIKPVQEDISDLDIDNLSWYIDEENKKIRLTWNPINLENTQYSIYIKNNLNQDEGYVLVESNILSNEYSIDIGEDDINMDIYVLGNIGDKYSKHSNTINIIRENISQE